MHMLAIKESEKQRECLSKRIAKKIDPTEQKGLFLLGFEPEPGVYKYIFEIRFCTVMLCGDTVCIYGIYTSYNTCTFLIGKHGFRVRF